MTETSIERCKRRWQINLKLICFYRRRNDDYSTENGPARLCAANTLGVHEKCFGRILWINVVAFILLSASGIQAQQQIGYVLDLRGNWVLDGNPQQQLSKSMTLSSVGVIRLRSQSSDEDFIQIADLEGNIIISKNCKVPNDCSQPIRLSKPVSSKSSVFTDIMKIVSTEVIKRAIFGSRSTGDQPLRESVIKLANGKLDLSPAFGEVDQGSYKLGFRPITIDDDSINLPRLGPVDFNWNRKASVPLSVPGIRPGLYLLEILDSDDEPETQAWILVTAPNEYDKASACFQDIIKLTQKWDHAVEEGTVRGILSGGLAYLSKQGRKCR